MQRGIVKVVGNGVHILAMHRSSNVALHLQEYEFQPRNFGIAIINRKF